MLSTSISIKHDVTVRSTTENLPQKELNIGTLGISPWNFSISLAGHLSETPSPMRARQPTTIVPHKNWQVAISPTADQQSRRKALVKLPWKQWQQRRHCLRDCLWLRTLLYIQCFEASFHSTQKKHHQLDSKGCGGCSFLQGLSRWNYRVKQWFSGKKNVRMGNGKQHTLGCLDMYSSFLKHVIKKAESQFLLHRPFHWVIIHHASSKGVKTF